ILERPGYMVSLLAIILVAKPLAALGIIWFLGYSVRTALTVAIALAQIGEFSFILAELGHQLQILDTGSQSLLVACSLISITLNPMLFHCIDPLERWLRKKEGLWEAINLRS